MTVIILGSHYFRWVLNGWTAGEVIWCVIFHFWPVIILTYATLCSGPVLQFVDSFLPHTSLLNHLTYTRQIQALHNLNYTILYSLNNDRAVQLYQMFPRLVKAILLTPEDIRACNSDIENCIQSDMNPNGIPLYKTFTWVSELFCLRLCHTPFRCVAYGVR